MGYYIDFDGTDTKFFLNIYPPRKNPEIAEKPIISLYTESYDDFQAMLDFLIFKMSDKAKENVISKYKQKLSEVKNDCNELDVIFETIPDFVVSNLEENIKWESLKSLLECSKSKWGNDEFQAIANLLNGFDKMYIYQKITENKTIFRKFANEIPTRLLSEYLYFFSKIGSSVWTNQELDEAGSTYAFPFEEKDSAFLYFGEKDIIFSGVFNTNAQNDFSIHQFKLGRGYAAFTPEMRFLSRQEVLEYKDYDYFSPINLIFDKENAIIIPAFLAYEIVVSNAPEDPKKEIQKELTSVLFPELTLAKFKGLGLLKMPKFSIKGKTFFDITKLKNLTPRVPSGKNLTNLKKVEFVDYGYQIKPTSGSLKDKVDDIIKNGDNMGTKTESVITDIFSQNGYKIADGKYGSNNGFDVVAYKGDIENPTEIIIVESKQFRYKNNVATELIEHNGIQLNPPSKTTDLPTQMSDKWIEYVGLKLENVGKTNTSDMLLYKDKITKYVSAIDKTTGEINFLKLDKFD